MAQMTFLSELDITEANLDYMANEAESLSELGDLDIENYGDREVLNPDVDDIDEPEDIDDQEAEEEVLVLGFNESVQAGKDRQKKFRKIKRKVRKTLCNIIDGLSNDDSLDLKDIFKSVLVAIIPVFGGVPALVSVIIMALIALFLRRGYDRVCPA